MERTDSENEIGMNWIVQVSIMNELTDFVCREEHSENIYAVNQLFKNQESKSEK